MSETQTVQNPYDNMPEGGGLRRTNRVTSIKYVQYGLTRKDGSAVINERTKQQSVFTGLRIEGVRVGDSKNEGRIDKYEFSAGDNVKPSPDGEMLIDKQGNPVAPAKKSNAGKAILALEKGGFNKSQLYPRVSVLTGAEIEFAGEDKLDKDGKPKTHVYEGKTYTDIVWFPVAYNGGAGSRPGNGASNGAGAEELETKAEAAVLAAIAEAGGSIERKDLIRALGTNLKGDADAIKITTLVARQDFHNGRPWAFDGSKLTLSA